MNETQQVLQELKAQGWTYVEVSAKIGVHVVTVKRWAAGQKPGYDHMIANTLRRLPPKDVAVKA